MHVQNLFKFALYALARLCIRVSEYMYVCLLARAYENVDDVFIGMQHANVQQLKRRMLDRKCIFAVKQRSVNPNVTYSLNRSAKQLFRLIHLSFIFLYEISRFNIKLYTCQTVCCLFFTLSPNFGFRDCNCHLDFHAFHSLRYRNV